MSELIPCPFCGKTMQRRDCDGLEEYTVWCSNCGAIGPNELSEKRADEMWNMRRPEDALRAQLAARDALIERLVEAGDGLVRYSTIGNIDQWDTLIAEYQAMKGGEA